jgi:hypothetical protein
MLEPIVESKILNKKQITKAIIVFVDNLRLHHLKVLRGEIFETEKLDITIRSQTLIFVKFSKKFN